MKNAIPLVVAVLFGLAAVFAVSNRLSKTERAAASGTETTAVLVARTDVRAGEVLSDKNLRTRRIPRAAFREGQHMRAEDLNLVSGQRVRAALSDGDYLFAGDLARAEGTDAGAAEPGKWIVPVHFSDSTLLRAGLLAAGDEFALVARGAIHRTVRGTDESEPARDVSEDGMYVLFPCLRVHRTAPDGAFVCLPPEEAMRLQLAQLSLELYPMLRMRNDPRNADAAALPQIRGSQLRAR
ncbi:MAG: hypothetical protein IJV65_02480 [Kiritimatiellae bacterium]|nr:hypothetical protein [Kiritimatiellia bacterium]